MQHKRPTPLLVEPVEVNPQVLSASPTTGSVTARRKKTRGQGSKRTNEEEIMQSHRQLMEYVEKIDGEVQGIVKSYEAQFLVAYRNHLKNVRGEMEELKRRSIQNMNEHRHYLDHIDVMEKQVILFREESIRISEKNLQQARKIEILTLQLKDEKKQNARLEAAVASLARKSKQAQAALRQLQNKQETYHRYQDKANLMSVNRTIDVATTISQPDHSLPNQMRPMTTSIRIKHNQLRDKSFKKSNLNWEGRGKVATIEQVQRNTGNTVQKGKQLYNQCDIQSQHFSNRQQRLSLRTRMKSNVNNSLRIRDSQIQMLKSKELAERKQYEFIFRECVQEVRRDVMRRSGMSGLNYFKQNGPLDLVEFKKIDYYMLLQLFLKNQRIISTFYQLIFQNGWKSSLLEENG